MNRLRAVCSVAFLWAAVAAFVWFVMRPIAPILGAWLD